MTKEPNIQDYKNDSDFHQYLKDMKIWEQEQEDEEDEEELENDEALHLREKRESKKYLPNEIPNLHILKVKYCWTRDNTAINISSERFRQKKIIDFNYNFNDALEGAIDWLTKNGFNIIGKAEGYGYYYLITNTFEPLKKK